MLTSLQVWDVTRGEKIGSLVGHENRVSCLGVSNDGISLCTGSWDSLVRTPFFPTSPISLTPPRSSRSGPTNLIGRRRHECPFSGYPIYCAASKGLSLPPFCF